MVKYIKSFGLFAICSLFLATVKAEDPIKPEDVVNACVNGLAPCVNMVHTNGPGTIKPTDESRVRGRTEVGTQTFVAFQETAAAIFNCGSGTETVIGFNNGFGALSKAPPMKWTWYAEPGNQDLKATHKNPMLHFICGV